MIILCWEEGTYGPYRNRIAFGNYSSQLLQLTAGPMLFGAMTWSPDGKKLFAQGLQDRGELIRYDAQHRAFVPFLSGIWATDLRFSRDGQWVAYVSYPEGTLWRSRVDGSDRLQLTNPPVSTALPRWSPDGTQRSASFPLHVALMRVEGKQLILRSFAALRVDVSDFLHPIFTHIGS